MTTYTWPTSAPFRAASIEWKHHRNQRSSTSQLNGTTQTVELPGMRWDMAVTFPAQTLEHRQQVEAFLTKLDGQANRVLAPRPGRTRPSGTINTTGVIAQPAIQFATGLTLLNCGSTKTLLAGDMLQVPTSTGDQLLMVADDATSNSAGSMTIATRPMLRGSVSSGSAVTLVSPMALFILAEPDLEFSTEAGYCPPLTIEFVEVFS